MTLIAQDTCEGGRHEVAWTLEELQEQIFAANQAAGDAVARIVFSCLHQNAG
jgi:hypothetical protein